MPVGGLYEHAQNLCLQVANAIYLNPNVPFRSEAGTPMDLAVTADSTMSYLKPAVVHVGIEGGDITPGGPYGIVGRTEDRTGLIHRLDITGASAVFSVYTGTDMERRYLLDWLPWGLLSAYTVDDAGLVFEGYLITWLRQWHLTPRRSPRMFTAPTYAPENTAESRPFGLPYRGALRMPFDQQLIWITAGNSMRASATITPLAGPALTNPINIAIPALAPPFGP